MFSYRVFISYSHSDRALVERLVEVLDQSGVYSMWDKNLLPGTGFSEQIQSFIRSAQVFLPVITAASIDRPWLHQEIGFAMALGKPILPVSLGHLPLGLISGLQAVELQDDLSDATAKLSVACFQRLMDAAKDRPATYECTDDNARRALLLAQYADEVWAIQSGGSVRQMASLTSFQIPNRGPGDPVWKKLFPTTPNDHFLFDALRRERVALEKHARARDCWLILDPVDRLESIYQRHGPAGVRPRLERLLEFLRDGSIGNVFVAINDDPERVSSLTVIGDWFSSEGVSSGRVRVLREAVFTRDARTVRQQIEDFDNRMRDLLALRGWTAANSRAQAIAYLQAHLDTLPQ